MNSSWQKAKPKVGRLTLGDLLEEFEERLGSRPEPEILTLTEKMGFVAQRDRFSKRLAIADTSNYKVIGLHDIALNPYLLWAGAIAQNTRWDVAIISPLYPTFKVRPGYSPRWVNYLVCGGFLLPRYGGISHGSVPRKRRAAVRDFLELEIDMPMPPLAEQERMVMLLDEASELRTLRAEADAHAAKLIPALFHEMFGKPTTDSAKWPVSTLGEVCSFIGGSSLPSGEPFSGQPDGLLLLKVGDMNEPGNDTSITSSREWIAARKSTYSQAGKGTIIIPKRGGSIATNKKRMLTRDALLDPNLMGIAPRTEMLSESYLFEWFRLFDLTRIASGSSVPQLNKQDLAPLRIAIPPLDVQGEFSELASEIREMEFAQAASREQLNALYHSTLHRVFKREL